MSVPPVWRRWLMYVTAALMPISINYERILGPQKRPHYFSPFDFLLGVLALLMIIDLVQGKAWARLKFPSLSTVIWSVVAIASYAWLQGGSMEEWAFAALNPAIVVLLSSWVFANVANDPAEFRKCALILCASFGVCVLYAFYQYIGPVGVPYNSSNPDALKTGTTNMRLGGWYDNRMLFGAQAAMFVPAAAAFAAFDKDPVVKAVAALMAALALCVTLAVGGFLGTVAGVVAVAAACMAARKCWAACAIITGIVLLLVVVLPKLPAKRNNAATLTRGLSLIAKPDETKDERIPTPRLRRYQAAIEYLRSHKVPTDEKSRPNWILGAGAGRFTPTINNFYDDKYYPKPGAATDDEARFDIEQHERDGFGLLEKTAVELGAVGLAAVALFFASWLVLAAGAFLREGDDTRRLLALASLGACVGAAVASIFMFTSQRGMSGGTLAFFFGVAVWLNARE